MIRRAVILALLLACPALAQNIPLISAAMLATASEDGYVPTNGLIYWCEAANVGTYTSVTYGVHATNMYDLSGNGNHAVATADTPAAPAVSNYGGRASLYFGGNTSPTFLTSFHVSNSTVVAVFTRPSTTAYNVLLGGASARPIPMYWAGNNQFIYAGFSAVGRTTAANNTTGLVCLATACTGGATNTTTAYLNGTALALPNALSSGAYGPITYVGRRIDIPSAGMHLMALFVYNFQYSASELAPLFRYINTKWTVW